MAEFLCNNDISASLDNIIKSTQGGSLLLISPYLKFSRRIKEALMDQVQAYRSHVDVVYGKHDLRPEEYKWLADNEIKTYYREPLHAKCYINESHALITSMNLYEFSQQNNDEMGILVSAKDDHDLYEKIKENAYLIRRQSEQVKLEVTRVDDDDDDLPAVNRMPLYVFAPNPRLRCRKPDSACGAALRFHATLKGRIVTRITEAGLGSRMRTTRRIIAIPAEPTMPPAWRSLCACPASGSTEAC